MKTMEIDSLTENLTIKVDERLDRRKFFRQAGMFGFGAAVSGLALAGKPAQAQGNSNQAADTTAELFTAFLIAEDLATTFYYNALIGSVIQDPSLAGPGGTATHITSNGNAGNVNYLQAALIQEFQHASLFRDVLTGTAGNQTNDPYQTFYFAPDTFSSISVFLATLNALENAFIGAYLTLIEELAYKATAALQGHLTGGDTKYSAQQYELFAKIAASILGVESEHRVLGRVIGNVNPANNYNYEQLDGLTSIYNGPNSAVVALTPFLAPGAGLTGYSLETAISNYRNVIGTTTSTGSQPSA
jgi:hypothetical protein